MLFDGQDGAVAAPRGHGKEIAHSTPVLTNKGWTVHGLLKKGDYVFSPSGKQLKVLAESSSGIDDYLVHTRDGEVIRCHADHEWVVKDRNNKKEVTIETNKMIGDWSEKGTRSRFLLPLRAALEFDEVNLPLDPYYLGLWLGDGCSTDTGIIHSKDDSDSINSIPYKISTINIHKKTGVVKTNFTGQNIQTVLKQLDVYGNKHIPSIFKFASKLQRLELLAGLIDSDGSVDKNRGRIRFVNINKILIDDVCELVTSLGMRPIITQQEPHSNGKGINGVSVCYTVQFNPIEDIPTKLKRKKIIRLPNRPMLGITKVEYLPNGEKGKCIEVDSPDGLYLVGKRLIPTHNSTITGLVFITFCVVNNLEKYIVYVSQNHAKTVQFLDPLRREFKVNEKTKMVIW